MNEQMIVKNDQGLGHSNGVLNYMRQATDVASVCREIVNATAQQIGVKRYVRVEGWQSIAIAHGCVASARDVERVEDGYRCIGEVKRMDTGQVISQAEGFLGDDEDMWSKRPVYARRAMVQTRAISRACRSAFAHIVVLIDRNLSTTPAEEVPHGGFDNEPLNTIKNEAPRAKITKDEVDEITAKLVSEQAPATEKRDMVLKFGKHKGSSLREIGQLPSGKGLDYLDWLAKQELKPAADGKPYANDLIRNQIIAEILAEADKPKDQDAIPF